MLISGATLLGIAGVLAVIVIVMFCNFRARIKKGAYQNIAKQTFSANPQTFYNPIIVYPNQTRYTQGGKVNDPTNLS